MNRAERPLSPHLLDYRWGITMTLSILHRATGLVLSMGLLVLICWLIALAAGEEVYGQVQAFYSAMWLVPLYLGWTFSLFYHLANGIRHMVWDTGRGFEPAQIQIGGWLVVVFAIAATALWSVLVIF